MADKMSKLVLPVKTGNTIAPKEFDVGGGGNTFVGTTAEWEALTAEQQNAYDCRVLTDDDLNTKSVIDNLTSDSATDALSAKQGKVLAQLVAPVLSTLVAPTGGLASGDQFIYQDLLYKATAAIAQGGTITINGNCTLSDDVTNQLAQLSSDLNNKIKIVAHSVGSITVNSMGALDINVQSSISSGYRLVNAVGNAGMSSSGKNLVIGTIGTESVRLLNFTSAAITTSPVLALILLKN